MTKLTTGLAGAAAAGVKFENVCDFLVAGQARSARVRVYRVVLACSIGLNECDSCMAFFAILENGLGCFASNSGHVWSPIRYNSKTTLLK